MVSIESLIVPVDGSPLADLGARVAVGLANRLGARTSLLAAAGALDIEHGARHAADLARTLGPDVTWSIDGCIDPVKAVADAFWRAENAVICMATHGRGRSSAVLGSVANDLIAHVHEPVVLVGPDVDPHSVEVGDRVVVCVDGGPVAEAAIGPAIDWARWLGVPLEIVTVVEPVPARTDGGPAHRMHGPSDPERYLHDVLARLDRPDDATTKVIEDPVSVPAGLHSYLRDDPAVLMVLTRDLHRDGARFAMGDRSATIVRRSPAPVLAVPA